MRTFVGDGYTFLYVNGLEAPRRIALGESVELLPGKAKYNESVINSFRSSDATYGLAHIFLPLVSSQLKVSCEDRERLGILTWNTLWDVVLLGALYDYDVECHFQSDTDASALDENSKITITNFHLRGLTKNPYKLSEAEADWLENNFSIARDLLDIDEFMHAAHCLSKYRWHLTPAARLAILWSGIEGLFNIESEVVFRLSLYISRFLEPENKEKREDLFKTVKRLYRQRSAAVHGSRIKGESTEAVLESVSLLSRLIFECVHRQGIPDVKDLAH